MSDYMDVPHEKKIGLLKTLKSTYPAITAELVILSWPWYAEIAEKKSSSALPDYQRIGVGKRFLNFVAELLTL
jgi:hypothetical protein